MYYFKKMTEQRRKFMILKQQCLNVNHPLQSAQQLLPAMQKYTGKSKHSTEKSPGKSRPLRSGRSKVHELFHSKHELNKTTLSKNCSSDRPVEEPASFFGQGL